LPPGGGINSVERVLRPSRRKAESTAAQIAADG